MMIKLQDFAREMGVTDRAIQKHLKKYEAELEGLFERKGPNGTWLTDEACEILRGKMKQQPIAIFEEDPRIERLETRVRELEGRLDEKEKLLALSQEQVQRSQEKVAELQEKVGEIRLLEQSKDLAERELETKDKMIELAEDRRLEAEQRATDLQALLDQIAGSRGMKRRKLLKELKKNKE